jgi:small neutral amino acid transporter SnatA (MarC family)
LTRPIVGGAEEEGPLELEVLKWTGATFAALLPLVNPLNAIPLFTVLTVDRTDAMRTSEATRAGVFAGVILVVTAVAGSVILGFFGLSLGMLQVAGGLIVGQAAWAMVTGNPQVSATETSTWAREKRLSLRRLVGMGGQADKADPVRALDAPAGTTTADEAHPQDESHPQDAAAAGPLAGQRERNRASAGPPRQTAAAHNDIAFSPVAMPVLAGPAAMGVVLGLTAQSTSVDADAGIIIGIALISLLCVIGLRACNPILHTLGGSGILALQRVFGFILLAIAVALVANGISALFGIPINTA